jgi:hypothetical protein
MTDWRAREIAISASMAALGAMWMSSAWSTGDMTPAHNVALKLAFAFTCFSVVANPFVLFEQRTFARLFAGYEPRAVAFGFLAAIGIFCALTALLLWVIKPLFS